MSIIFIILFAVIGLGLLIFFHELGHFLVAKRFGIVVETFSIGMGPGIVKFTRDGTVYQIGAVPFGGFCKFKGDELTDDPDKARDPDSFYGAPAWQRLIVAFCGPFMNYLLAIVFLAVLAMGSEYYLEPRVLLSEDFYSTEEDADKTAAYNAGMKSGDLITKIGNYKVETFDDLKLYLAWEVRFNRKETDVTVLRDGEEIVLSVKPDWNPRQMRPLLGVQPWDEPVVEREKSDSSTLTSYLDLQDGDRIVRIDDMTENLTFQTVIIYLQSNYGEEVTSTIEVLREDRIIVKTVDFKKLSSEIKKEDFYITFERLRRSKAGLNPFKALAVGFKESNFYVALSVVGIHALIFKEKEQVNKQLGGPIAIAAMIGENTLLGFKENFLMGLRTFFYIISVISLALAFFNLLPIPAVDGGHIMLNLYEIITRKPLSLKIIYRINFIGFMVLISLLIFMTFNDVINLVGRAIQSP
jgi:regulator of sigma E protease